MGVIVVQSGPFRPVYLLPAMERQFLERTDRLLNKCSLKKE